MYNCQIKFYSFRDDRWCSYSVRNPGHTRYIVQLPKVHYSGCNLDYQDLIIGPMNVHWETHYVRLRELDNEGTTVMTKSAGVDPRFYCNYEQSTNICRQVVMNDPHTSSKIG